MAGQQHGLVVSGEDGRPLRPAVLWNDTRSAPDAERLREELGAERWAHERRRGARALLHGHALGLAAAHRARAWPSRTRAIRLPHDWLTERLCGRAATDRGDASGTGWWSTRDEELRRRGARAAGRRARPGDAAGRARPGRGGRRGRRRRPPRSSACPRASSWGPGRATTWLLRWGSGLAPGEPVISLGTSGTAYAAMTERAVDPSGMIAGFADATGGFLPLAATLNCTLAVDRVAELARPRARGGGRQHRGHGAALPRRRAHAQPSARGGNHHRAAPRHHPRADAAGRLRGRGGIVDRGARAAGLGGLGTGRRRAGGADRRRSARARRGSARWPAWPAAPCRCPRPRSSWRSARRPRRRRVVSGEPPEQIARRWDGRRGVTVDPPEEADSSTLARIRAVREAASDLLEPPSN